MTPRSGLQTDLQSSWRQEMFFAIGKRAEDLEPYFFTLVMAGSRSWRALRVKWSVKRIANSHRMQCLPTWQYARLLLPTNPTHERNATLPSPGLGDPLLLSASLQTVRGPASKDVLLPASNALNWSQSYRTTYVRWIILALHPDHATLLEKVPGGQSTLSGGFGLKQRLSEVGCDIITKLAAWCSASSGDCCISERGPNITMQEQSA